MFKCKVYYFISKQDSEMHHNCVEDLNIGILNYFRDQGVTVDQKTQR